MCGHPGWPLACRDCPWKIKNTPLHRAAYNGHKEVAEVLLAEGADVDATNKVRSEGERERGRTRGQVVEGGRTRRLEEGDRHVCECAYEWVDVCVDVQGVLVGVALVLTVRVCKCACVCMSGEYGSF